MELVFIYVVNIQVELLSSSQINHPLYVEDDLDYLYNQNGERIEKGVERKWDGKMWKITYMWS